jgi:hypothetical protein
MNDAKKYAYRYMLYTATLEIRALSGAGFRLSRLIHPLTWRTIFRRIDQSATIADWMHNLALFSSLEFVGFEEDRFWHEYGRILPNYPELERYKNRFDKALLEGNQQKSTA